MSDLATDPFTVAWQQWRAQRDTAVHAPDGPASLVATYWPDESDTIPGVPGSWSVNDGEVRLTLDSGASAVVDGQTVTGEIVALAAGAPQGPRIDLGEITAHVVTRVGRAGVRIYDHSRSSAVADIALFDPSQQWVVDATFTPFEGGSRSVLYNFAREQDAREVKAAGVLSFELDGELHTVEPMPAGDGLFLVFADATTGDESEPVGRFLSIPAPAADGTVKIDFNRAYLRNCAFSEQMNCPIPPQSNRLSVAIAAGEKRVLWS